MLVVVKRCANTIDRVETSHRQNPLELANGGVMPMHAGVDEVGIVAPVTSKLRTLTGLAAGGESW